MMPFDWLRFRQPSAFFGTGGPMLGRPQNQGFQSPFNPQVQAMARQQMQLPSNPSAPSPVGLFGTGQPMPPVAINSGPSYDPFQNPGSLLPMGPPSQTISGGGPGGNYGGGLPGFLSPLGTQFTMGPGGSFLDPQGFPRATAVNPSQDPYGLSGGPVVGPQPNPVDSASPGMASMLGLLGISARNI